ncbi:hypothetical protein LK996_10620 [Lysobacter sp. A6]|uniref:Uncharacterized protein n=1 Tax=Noviluteimonas lactosilytica TaxID=2888523 RepID=A0ABS8JJ33_9GAMM|nr:hypothetical protein [Lysobacter lactosilyticus]MCC8363525.1 hypothetical protein [Lysobacter lactosilyticus]
MSAPASTLATPEPFWQRIPSIILYPVRGAALVMLVMLAVAAIFRGIPLLGLVVSIAMWVGAYKFAFEVLRRTADGHMDSPEVAISVDNGVVWRFLGLQLILGLLLGVCLLTGSEVVFFGGLALLVFLQPALTMTLAMTESLGDALSPSNAFSIVARIGWPYLAVVGLLFVIQASAMTAGAWLAAFMPGPVAGWLATVLGFWGLFSAFHLMGYLLYQSHEALGFDPGVAQLAALRSQYTPASVDDVVAEAEARVRDGRIDEARSLLRGEINTRAVGPEVHDLYRRLLQQAGNAEAVNEHARQYLHRLMLDKQERRALGLLRECLDADATFVPLEIAHGERLAEQARFGGQAQLAVDTLHALFNAHPRHPDSARWGLQAAMLLLERFDRGSEAKVLLERTRARTEDEAMLQKIDAAMALV